MELAYGSVERVLAPALRFWFRWEIAGLERLPRRGPVLVAANHVSMFDPFVVAFALHEVGLRARFLAKAELFRNPALGFVLRRLRQIPVHRGRGDARSLDLAEAALWRGEAVVVFPEGTIGPGLPLLPLKSGVARVAIASGLPVTPVAIWGGQHVVPKGGRPTPRKGTRLRVLVGRPIDPPAAVVEPGHVRALTTAVTDRLTELVSRIAEE